MKTITIEWKHLDQDGKTCARCADTGKGLAEIVRELAAECSPKGVEIYLKETKLPAGEIGQSNLILINGTPLENILPATSSSVSNCCSCGELTGQEECCRTIVRFGTVHEAIPSDFIREAICRVAGCC